MKVKIIDKKYHKRIIIDFENEPIDYTSQIHELVEILNKYSGHEMVVTNYHRYSATSPNFHVLWLGNIIDEGVNYRFENITGASIPTSSTNATLISKYKLVKSDGSLPEFFAFSNSKFTVDRDTQVISLK